MKWVRGRQQNMRCWKPGRGEQAREDQLNPPEYVFLQDVADQMIEVSGTMSFYDVDGLSRGIGELLHATFENSVRLEVLGKAWWNPYIVWMKLDIGDKIMVDLQNQPDDVSISGLNLMDLPSINVELRPNPTVEDVVTSFQRSPIATENTFGTVNTFPIAQDPAETEIIQLAVRNPDAHPSMTDFRHPGLDFFAPAGTEVISVTSGEIVGIYIPSKTDFEYDAYGTEVENLEGRGMMLDPRQLYSDSPAGHTEVRRTIASGWLAEGGEGAYIIVRTGNTYFLYAHLDPSSIQVGTHVQEGQTIGRIGQSEDGPQGEHLHFETRIHVSGTLDIDGQTGDYIDAGDKPLIFVNPALYFTEELVSAFNYGLELRNKKADERGRFEQRNVPSPDAFAQNTQVIDEGANLLYVRNIRPGYEDLERQFDPEAHWLHGTDVIVSEEN